MQQFCFFGSYLICSFSYYIIADQLLFDRSVAAHNATDFSTAAELVAR
jgi:hypothetical protein